jgi:large subunit ribosomal protein L16|uniref:Ribosomal protein L16 n=1 Tax=Sundstroemia setigera TaxID=3005 RepID=A0A8A6KFJ7_9STRA|nr:ribosomal protein L16 [Rhizosolenia setigera]QTI82387.1 ribosomal protein L16 [Rhizosolenia setigera]WAQ69950.1 ribosomal protein L16 [Rhizosolenia setigera]WAQ69986.1 ribosomal protein L16 [Rhizosolenia setigera]WAQ70022.1 ribosomal protein L16 [Rhizosolenia setigera]WAQ70058.1 ribosomal protein L16 [Rhizosolenia setigera]
MLLQPKKTKYKKIQKGNIRKKSFNNKLVFGSFGLKAIKSGLIKANQLEATRQVIRRKLKRKGKLWIKIFPYTPMTSKSVGVRMGKGKGSINYWCYKVKTGTILFEICGVTKTLALNALLSGSHKLPVKTKLVY